MKLLPVYAQIHERQSNWMNIDTHLHTMALRIAGENGLGHRIAQGVFNLRTGQEDLEHVFRIPHPLLPRGAMRQAEQLQYSYDRAASKRGEEAEGARRQVMEKSHQFFSEVLPHVAQAKKYWLHILEHGELPNGVDAEQHAHLLAEAKHRRLVLAQLKMRWLASRLPDRNSLASTFIRSSLTGLVREREITPQQKQQLIHYEQRHGEARRTGMSPISYRNYLAQLLGIHPDEVRAADRWTIQDLEEITGIKLQDLLKAKKRRSRTKASPVTDFDRITRKWTQEDIVGEPGLRLREALSRKREKKPGK